MSAERRTVQSSMELLMGGDEKSRDTLVLNHWLIPDPAVQENVHRI